MKDVCQNIQFMYDICICIFSHKQMHKYDDREVLQVHVIGPLAQFQIGIPGQSLPN